MKEISLSTDEVIAKFYVKGVRQLETSTINIIKFYDNLTKITLEQIRYLEMKEPLKIFRKTHRIWQDKINITKEKYNKYNDNLFEEYNFLEDVLRLSNFN